MTPLSQTVIDCGPSTARYKLRESEPMHSPDLKPDEAASSDFKNGTARLQWIESARSASIDAAVESAISSSPKSWTSEIGRPCLFRSDAEEAAKI
jgi:hypothetical protein